MPPPPPPSKSYSIVIVDSSDEEEEEPSVVRVMGTTVGEENPCVVTAASSAVAVASVVYDDDDTTLSDDFTKDDASTVVTASSSHSSRASTQAKKKKKKKKKKKSKSKKPAAVVAIMPETSEDTNAQVTAAAVASPDVAWATAVNATLFSSSSPISNKKKHDKSVRFGSMEVREYKRCMGPNVVPLDGGWPLGLEWEVISESEIDGGVDAFQEAKQEELRSRWMQVMSQRLQQALQLEHHSSHSSSSPNTTSTTTTPSFEELQQTLKVPDAHTNGGRPLETRQYDYLNTSQRRRSRSLSSCSQFDNLEELLDDGKNPLFGSLKEDDRAFLLIRDIPGSSDGDGASDDGNTATISSGSTSFGHSTNGHVPLKKSRQRPRSNSNADRHHRAGRPRSGSNAGDDNYLWHNNGVFSRTEIMHVRNELELTRNGRAMTGCACRKTKNKQQHGRKKGMPERKVKEELRRRNLLRLDENHKKMSREALEARLLKAMEEEPCCWGDDCECVRNGIDCQSDACSCWQPSHDKTHHSKSSSTNPASDVSSSSDTSNVIQTMQMQCGNPNGLYVVAFDEINSHRKTILETLEQDGNLFCQPTMDNDWHMTA